MSTPTRQADVVIAGGGLAGLVTACELLDHGRKVLVIDKDKPEKLGGLAKESFGGVHMVDTPYQRRMGLRDSPELAWQDWLSYADFAGDDEWPRRWAMHYCERSVPEIFEFLDGKQVKFLPLVNWPERGVFKPGNSIPRWHITWGTGWEIIERVLQALAAHPRRADLEILCDTEVSGLELEGGRVVGVQCRSMIDQSTFVAKGDAVVIASGGICGGDLSRVRAHWYKPWGEPPAIILNGAHDYGDGMLHDRVAALGGNLTHLDLQWHYAAGVHHPSKRRPHDGLSLVPPRSALWFNAVGERIGPAPLVGYGDTRWVVENILRQPGQYSWQIMNRKIALKELAVSGCDYMSAFRFKSKAKMIRNLLLGNHELVDRLIRECPDDIVVAASVSEMVDKMNERSLFGLQVDGERLAADIAAYDDIIARGPAYWNDDQVRRIESYRKYRGDRIRLCKPTRIADPKAGPLIAIREFILSRKSLGGIQTNLDSQVLRADGSTIDGLYAVGESAGFGGGGIHGKGSLEGTFLGGCVLTGRAAGRAIAGATR